MTADGAVGGRYRLHDQIGSGGMGVVWRATDELLGRQVAIKRIRLDLLDGDTAELTRQRTLREARIAAQLHHPHVVSIFDVLIVEGDPWLVLEYLPSESLSDALERHGPMPSRDAAALGAQVADALAAAHAAGIVHRDIKPGNVLLGRAGAVKLTDFGISHAAGDVTLTRTNLLTGTPAFLSPEVARGGPGAAPSDVYSLGATLYAAVEGQPPYGHGHENVFRLLQLVAAGQVPTPQRAGPLAPALARLMDVDPARRPSAVEARELLREVAQRQPEAPTREVRPPTVPLPGGPPGHHPSHPPSNPVVGPYGHPAGSGWTGPPVGSPVAPQRRSRRWVVAAAVAAVLVIAAGTVAALTLPRPGPVDPIAQPSTTATAPPTTGVRATGSPIPGADPRTADPCSLVDPVPLQVYGQAQLDVDFASFATCQMSVFPPAGGATIVSAQFSTALPPGDTLPGTVEVRGALTIGREVEDAGYCARTILLADRSQVLVTASERGADSDVCAMADTATETALTRLTTTGITTRPLIDAPNSLAQVDACSLLDDGALAAVPGLVDTGPEPGFANWTCTWGDTPSVNVFLTRQDTIDADDGTPSTIGDRQVLTLPRSYANSQSCLVQVVHRSFVAADGQPRVEKFQVLYNGLSGDSVDQLCVVATQLATTAIPKLPPLR